MRAAVDLLSHYATYHRDRRNIASHFVGVPLIVFAIGLLLSRPSFAVGGWLLSPAWLLFGAAAAWWVSRGNLVLGVATSAGTGLLLLAAHRLGGTVAASLAWGIACFLVGWAIQFAGHWYEGRKPQFVDDLVGLLVGPMFVAAEGLFSLGWGKALLAEIERRAGPTHLRDLAAIRA